MRALHNLNAFSISCLSVFWCGGAGVVQGNLLLLYPNKEAYNRVSRRRHSKLLIGREGLCIIERLHLRTLTTR